MSAQPATRGRLSVKGTARLARGGLAERIGHDKFVYVLAIPVFLILLFFVVIPMVQTAVSSTKGAGFAANYTGFFNGASLSALGLSVGTSLASVVLCGVVGTLLAVLLTRFDFPGRKVLEVFAILPMALPPLIGTVSFVLLYSETGIVPRALHALLGIDPASTAISGIAGVLVVHTFTMYPFFYLSVTAGLAGLDSSLESAAANLGAGKLRTWATVILPMLTPALVSGALLTFMISMASFTAPQLYNVQTLTMQIVSTRTAGAHELAAAQSTILSIVSILFLVAMRWYQGRRIHRSLSKGTQRDRAVSTGAARYLALIGTVALSVILVAPVLVIVLVSFSVDSSWTTQVLPEQYTLANYTGIFTNPRSLLPINVSVQMSVLATLGAVVIGSLAAWIISRWKLGGKTLLDLAIMLPWALPGTVIGVNLVTAFNDPNPGNLGLRLVGTLWILPVAYFVRYVPLVFRSTSASLDQLDPSVEEAARNLGASPARVLRTITLPLVSKGILAGALLAFVDGVGEYVASVVIYPAGFVPMSVAIYNRIYSAEFGAAAAYGTLQIVLILIVLIISKALERDKKEKSGQDAATNTMAGPIV
ncbi:ABC transporter permease [Psychromicrobium xiongbiense]|uniref:ABC transporter permease n=1 Tax=Psychromicrobium xiongbiense TaxID=3051184 RepID=UPI00255332B4|nr:iron ABC transporter permease [Psychromicrobium sp. YIM S02556]